MIYVLLCVSDPGGCYRQVREVCTTNQHTSHCKQYNISPEIMGASSANTYNTMDLLPALIAIKLYCRYTLGTSREHKGDANTRASKIIVFSLKLD